jgi:hypothetical protein
MKQRHQSYGTFCKGSEESLRAHPKAHETVATSSGCYFPDASKCVKASKVDGVHLDPSAHRILAMEIKRIVVSVLQKDKQRARERRRQVPEGRS